MPTLVIETRNRHKSGEIWAVLGEGAGRLTLHELPDAPEAIEDGDTFAANARKKALGLAAWMAAPSRLRPTVRQLPSHSYGAVAHNSAATCCHIRAANQGGNRDKEVHSVKRGLRT